jgi:hypothetical protein
MTRVFYEYPRHAEAKRTRLVEGRADAISLIGAMLWFGPCASRFTKAHPVMNPASSSQVLDPYPWITRKRFLNPLDAMRGRFRQKLLPEKPEVCRGEEALF